MDTEGRKIPAEYYAASYKNNTKAGKATVTVRFKDGYSGTVKKAFTIRPAGTSIQKLTAASGGFAVKWKKKTAQVSGYQIQYSADKGFKGSSTRSVSVKKASITGKEVKKTESREKILCAHPHLQNGKGGWEKHESILRMERRRPGKDAPGIRREKHSICCPGNDIYRVQMPNSTPHVCRHTYCSNMAKSGMNPKTLQYLMGHSDIGVTLNTYTHLGLEDATDELKRMEELADARKELEEKGKDSTGRCIYRSGNHPCLIPR